VTKYTLHGGKQEDVDAILVENGVLHFNRHPHPRHERPAGRQRRRAAWLGFTGEGGRQPAPHQSLQPRRPRWLEGFSEWMVRCGLESNGHPGTDKFINNVGDEATMELTLHGKIGNIPASEVEVVVDREPPLPHSHPRRVTSACLYGPKLEIWTEISTVPAPASCAFRHGDESRDYERRVGCDLPRPPLAWGDVADLAVEGEFHGGSSPTLLMNLSVPGWPLLSRPQRPSLR